MANTAINAGKVNFNVKTAKAFRDLMAIWHIFDFEYDDMRKKKVSQVKNAKGIIATNEELIAKKDFSLHDETYYQTQIASMRQSIADAEKRLADWKNEQEKTVEKTTAIFTKALYAEYVKFMAENDATWRVSAYTQAIADLLTENGLTPAWDTLDTLVHCVKMTNGTGSTKAETHKHLRPQTEGTWRKLFMATLCDLMGDILPTYKFRYILTKEERKAQRQAQKAQNK